MKLISKKSKTRKYKKTYPPTDLIERAQLAERRVKELRINITKSEERVMMLLDKLGYEYIFQYPEFDEWYFVIADFYLPKYMMMIEVDGDSHLGKEIKLKEAKRKRWLEKSSILVLRIKNKATFNMTPSELENKILRLYYKNNNKKS